jgi:AcrR family transcriptional regulator
MTNAVSKKTEQSTKTRESLLSECLVLFAERGFTNTSIDDIARAAGVTKGAIYWHFKSKDDLFDAILERIRTRWQDVVLKPVIGRHGSRGQLEQLFDSYVNLFLESPEICLFLQQVLLDQHNRVFSAQVAKVFARTARFVTRIIEEGKTSGVVRADVDSVKMAHLILGMLAGASQQVLTSRTLSLKELAAEAKAMTLGRVLCGHKRIT